MRSELPTRKPSRLSEYNYSTPGLYFITICTHGKRKLLSAIVVDGVLDIPKNRLTFYGKISDKYINQISKFYNHISVDKYIIMPNHIHIILNVSDRNLGTSGMPSPTNSAVAQFVATFKRFCNREYDKNIWQRSYHDHIIRSEKDYLKIWKYIDTNVLKWTNDCFYN